MAKTTVTFSLDTETDRDILRWLEKQAKSQRSAAVRDALRDHMSRNSITLGDVYQAVKDLEHKLQAGASVAAGPDGSSNWDEPLEAAAALDALARL